MINAIICQGSNNFLMHKENELKIATFEEYGSRGIIISILF
jgi:hypothetical protein